MGVRFPTAQSNTLVVGTILTTAETVLLTTPPLNPSLDFAVVLIQFYVLIIAGTAATFTVPRLRRGTSTAGTLINVASGISVTAGLNSLVSGCYFDTPGAVAGQQYSLSLSMTAATGNTSVLDGSILAFAL